jgi:ADP-ribose pyrophosphatase YjhB (NUDIX family)
MMLRQRFHYCPKCGGALSYREQGGSKRLTCRSCGFIYYENPVVGVAAVVFDDSGRVLLGRRNGSCRGLWCIPCGYVEYEEDVYDAIRREFIEETNLEIKVTGILAVRSNFHNPELHTVGVWFSAEITGGTLQPREDLDDAGFFDLEDLPPLAFPTDAAVLEDIRRSAAGKGVGI